MLSFSLANLALSGWSHLYLLIHSHRATSGFETYAGSGIYRASHRRALEYCFKEKVLLQRARLLIWLALMIRQYNRPDIEIPNIPALHQAMDKQDSSVAGIPDLHFHLCILTFLIECIAYGSLCRGLNKLELSFCPFPQSTLRYFWFDFSPFVYLESLRVSNISFDKDIVILVRFLKVLFRFWEENSRRILTQ